MIDRVNDFFHATRFQDNSQHTSSNICWPRIMLAV